MWDLPAFDDTLGTEHQLANEMMIREIIKNIDKIKIGLVIESADFYHGMNEANRIIHYFARFFRHEIEQIKNAFFLVITKRNRAKMKIERKLQKLAERENEKDSKPYQIVISHLRNNIDNIIIFPCDIENEQERRVIDFEKIAKAQFTSTKNFDYRKLCCMAKDSNIKEDIHFLKKGVESLFEQINYQMIASNNKIRVKINSYKEFREKVKESLQLTDLGKTLKFLEKIFECEESFNEKVN